MYASPHKYLLLSCVWVMLYIFQTPHFLSSLCNVEFSDPGILQILSTCFRKYPRAMSSSRQFLADPESQLNHYFGRSSLCRKCKNKNENEKKGQCWGNVFAWQFVLRKATWIVRATWPPVNSPLIERHFPCPHLQGFFINISSSRAYFNTFLKSKTDLTSFKYNLHITKCTLFK